jgi:hypothetical protein
MIWACPERLGGRRSHAWFAGSPDSIIKGTKHTEE